MIENSLDLSNRQFSPEGGSNSKKRGVVFSKKPKK